MNPEVKTAWTTALRSGDYKQGKNRLRSRHDDGHAYCCLGVLCELAVESGVIPPPQVGGHYGTGEDMDQALPPRQVVDWARLDDSNPMLPCGDGGDPTGLAALNDGDGVDSLGFREIADLIEAHL